MTPSHRCGGSVRSMVDDADRRAARGQGGVCRDGGWMREAICGGSSVGARCGAVADGVGFGNSKLITLLVEAASKSRERKEKRTRKQRNSASLSAACANNRVSANNKNNPPLRQPERTTTATTTHQQRRQQPTTAVAAAAVAARRRNKTSKDAQLGQYSSLHEERASGFVDSQADVLLERDSATRLALLLLE